MPRVILAMLLSFGLYPAPTPAAGGSTQPTTQGSRLPRVLARLKGHGGSMVRFSPDDSLLMTVGKRDVQVWDSKTFAEIGQPLTFPQDFVTAGFTSGGQTAYLADSKGLRLWNPRTGKRIGPGIHAPSPIYAAAVSPDGSRAAVNWTLPSSAFSDDTHLYDTKTGKEVRRLPHTNETVFALFSPDGRRLLTMERVGMSSGRFHVWDLSRGKDLFPPFETGCDRNCPPGEVSSPPAAFTPDGRRFVVIAGGSFAAFDTDTGRMVAGKVPQYDRGSPVYGLAITSDGRRVTCVQSTNAAVYDIATARLLGNWTYAQGMIFNFAVSPDAALLVGTYHVGTEGDREIIATGIWNLTTNRLIDRLYSADGLPAFNSSGNLLAVTGTGEWKEDTTIWDVTNLNR